MTDIYFTQNADHKITGFVSSGHSGFARRGRDIGCAAISALTITAVNSIEQIAKADADVKQDVRTGRISLHLKSEPTEKTETILRSLLLGLKGIEADYGGRHCKVTVKEELQC